MRMTAAAALMALLAAIAVGCGSGSDDTGRLPTAGSAETRAASDAEVPEVRWALNASLQALNITTAPDGTSVSLLANVLQGLLAYDRDGNLRPSLASSWRAVSPTEYRYTLRSGVRFSDGKPVTPEDILYSMRFAMNPRTGGAASSFYLSVKSIDQTAPDEITVKLRHPDPGWKYTPGHWSGWIYEKAAAVKAGSKFGGPRGIPIGSGPYEITQFSSDHVTFVRNPYYAGQRPKAARVTVSFITDDATRLAAMQSGDIDGTFTVPLEDTAQWQKVPSVDLLSVGSPNITYLFFNTTRAPFDDVHVRRALMYAFNREAVVRNLLHGNARVANTIVPPELWVNENLTPEQVEARRADLGPEYPYDIEKAKAELAKSRYPRGFSTTVIYTSASAEVGTGMQVLAQSLKELNVDLKLRTITDADFAKLFVPRPDFSLVAGPGAADYPDPLNLMGQALCSCQAVPNGFNMSGYKNEQLDSLIADATADPDATTRVDKIMQGLAIANEQLPFTVLWWDNTVAAVNTKLVLDGYGFWTSFLTPWMSSIRAAASQ